MKRIKVRFHLGKGKNYMHWKIIYPNGDIQFVHPTEKQLHLIDCQLKNSKKTAQRIFEGYEKVVCAWVLCDEVRIRDANFMTNVRENQVKYNPKVAPNWMFQGKDADGEKFSFLYSVDYGLYAK